MVYGVPLLLTGCWIISAHVILLHLVLLANLFISSLYFTLFLELLHKSLEALEVAALFAMFIVWHVHSYHGVLEIMTVSHKFVFQLQKNSTSYHQVCII